MLRFITLLTAFVVAPSIKAFVTNRPAKVFVENPREAVSVVNALSREETEVTRAGFLQNAKVFSFGTVASLVTFGWSNVAKAEGDSVTLPSGVVYTVTKAGDGPKPEIGELVAIRFQAICGDNVIDDIFETPEPYYTRVGAGGLLKGVEEVIPKMRVGDRWLLTIPGDMAFGKKGRPASAGKPRIPSDATIVFDMEMVGLPGREQELIDLIGDD